MRIFGSAYIKLQKNHNSTPLVLIPQSPLQDLSQPTVVIQQISPVKQDYFVLGVGVDLVALIHKYTSKASSPEPSATATK
jgi:hypothetical protein